MANPSVLIYIARTTYGGMNSEDVTRVAKGGFWHLSSAHTQLRDTHEGQKAGLPLKCKHRRECQPCSKSRAPAGRMRCGLLLWRAVELGTSQIKYAQKDSIYTYNVA